MKNRIFGAIGVLWGGAVAFRTFTMQHSGGSSAYHAGESAAGYFGLAMFAAGLYYLVKGSGKSNAEKDKP